MAPKAPLRRTWFPVADELTRHEQDEWRRKERLARWFKTTVEAIEADEARDDIPDFWQQLKGQTDMANENAEKVLAEGWDEVDKSVGSGGQWMKWADNQIIKLNICGIPRHVERDYQGELKKRISIEVFVPGEGCKTWEMAPATWKDLKEERESAKKDQPFVDALFSVKRTGSGKDTRYRFRYERQLNAAEADERGANANTKTVGGDDIPF